MFGGGGDDSEAFKEYERMMREQAERYNPWINSGKKGIEGAYSQYEKLLSNPNFLQDMISGDFYNSPYQSLMQDQVTKRMNMNAANTGMLGSGGANRALQNELTAMTGQFMNDYTNRGMGSYAQGLQGMYNTGALGLNALNSQSPLMGEAAGAALQAERSASGGESNMWGNILGIAGGIVGGIYGGPAGAAAGYSLGSGVGGAIGGGGGGGGGMGGFGGGGGGRSGGGGSTLNLGSLLGGMGGGMGGSSGNAGTGLNFSSLFGGMGGGGLR